MGSGAESLFLIQLRIIDTESRAMAVVITVAQQKGGTGKTTLAANIGAALAATRRVALLDIDPQHSLTRWNALRPDSAAKLTFSPAGA